MPALNGPRSKRERLEADVDTLGQMRGGYVFAHGIDPRLRYAWEKWVEQRAATAGMTISCAVTPAKCCEPKGRIGVERFEGAEPLA